MPTYDYLCQACGHRMEVSQSISAPPLEQCDCCSSLSLQRGVGGGLAVQFKGKGFYKTDYPTSCDSSGKCCPCSGDS